MKHKLLLCPIELRRGRPATYTMATQVDPPLLRYAGRLHLGYFGGDHAE